MRELRRTLAENLGQHMDSLALDDAESYLASVLGSLGAEAHVAVEAHPADPLPAESLASSVDRSAASPEPLPAEQPEPPRPSSPAAATTGRSVQVPRTRRAVGSSLGAPRVSNQSTQFTVTSAPDPSVPGAHNGHFAPVP